jgi:outer membrane protein assembly factor BamD (BamD/ComL family)
LLIVASCQNTTNPPLVEAGNSSTQNVKRASIQKLEKRMRCSRVLNTSVGQDAVHQYMAYAADYPEDTISDDYLFKAGEIATDLKHYPNAVKCYETISTLYPSFIHARESLYLQGVLFDSFLNDDARAKQVYEQFLSKYTYGNYVEDAKAAIANLEKADETTVGPLLKGKSN